MSLSDILQKCSLSQEFSTDLLSAYLKTLAPGKSCETNMTTSEGREVHVIHVEPPTDQHQTGSQRRPTVLIGLHSRGQADLQGESFVVVE